MSGTLKCWYHTCKRSDKVLHMSGGCDLEEEYGIWWKGHKSIFLEKEVLVSGEMRNYMKCKDERQLLASDFLTLWHLLSDCCLVDS